MQTKTKKRLLIWLSWSVLLVETALITIYHHEVATFLVHYGWVAPALLFKSFIKKFLLLNVFGLLKVLAALLWHLSKLLLLKLLKTFGLRYGSYFSSLRWQKMSQYLRVFTKKMSRWQKQFQQFMLAFRKRDYVLILFAFFPFFVLLFLFGVAFRMTREAMVKKGSELGVAKVAYSTVHKSEGFIARLKQLDAKILAYIDKLTK